MTTVIPTIHLNGSHAPTLLAEHMTAIETLRVAIDAVSQTAPNGRDYYVQGPDAINHAMNAHSKRLRDLNAILREIETLAESIDDQMM